MKRWLLAALATLCLATPAFAQTSRLDLIIARGTLRVGLTGDYKPFSIVDKSAPLGMTGLDVDAAQSLAQSLGVKLEIVQTAWPHLMADLLADRYDIAMGGITITLARQRTALFSTSVMRAGKTAIARCANASKYGSLAAIDQPGVRVAMNPGGTNETFDRANLHQATIVPFSDNAAIFADLVAGKADVMITDGVETRLQQKLHPELCAIHPNHPFNTSELGYMLPRDPIWQAYVNQWLAITNDTGDRQKLVAKWLD